MSTAIIAMLGIAGALYVFSTLIVALAYVIKWGGPPLRRRLARRMGREDWLR